MPSRTFSIASSCGPKPPCAAACPAAPQPASRAAASHACLIFKGRCSSTVRCGSIRARAEVSSGRKGSNHRENRNFSLFHVVGGTTVLVEVHRLDRNERTAQGTRRRHVARNNRIDPSLDLPHRVV